ncbi:hypothetical protein [Actinomadura rubrisoli]|uniref:Uncharacterized protein n=1 Tax=Actinomadura rubrisoli TaxID=2530368 RepID=A0A4R5BDF8_9ACTN|nr:hypothetical protein [Actinomadura rubrisoli]TDD83289.1 hypothetical protein E1298_21480 [Actinomadura rubrisoli]
MIVAGVAAAPAVGAGLFMDEMRAWEALAGIAFWLVLVLWLVGGGVARLRRAARSRWTAFAIEPEGVRVGARFGCPPQFFPWTDVDAVVRFDVPRIVRREPVRHLGVSLRRDAPGGLADFGARLTAARENPALPEADREILDHMAERLAEETFPRDHAVSAYVRQRDWRFDRRALERALRDLAPGIPLVELPADRPPHEWLDDRDHLDGMAPAE